MKKSKLNIINTINIKNILLILAINFINPINSAYAKNSENSENPENLKTNQVAQIAELKKFSDKDLSLKDAVNQNQNQKLFFNINLKKTNLNNKKILTEKPIQIQNLKLELGIANTNAAKELGLMHTKITENQGMLFVFNKEQPCFWMKNTPSDLSIFFLKPNGQIVQKAYMQANTLNSHCATENISYALELHANMFTKVNIGDYLTPPTKKQNK